MRIDRLTQKVREALMHAQEIATQEQQQAIEVPHMVLALIDQEGGVVPPLLEKMGVSARAIEEQMRALLGKLPKVSGGQPYMGSELNLALQSGWQHAQKMGDSYLSTEHLLLAITEQKSAAAELLQKLGITTASVLGKVWSRFNRRSTQR
jgi:ATP-dependent Clp protease ATP-binding subunit ClpB